MEFMYLVLVFATSVCSTTVVLRRPEEPSDNVARRPSFHLLFPIGSKNSSVYLLPTLHYPMDAFSICFRVRPSSVNESNHNPILSYAVPKSDNEILVDLTPTGKAQYFIKGNSTTFHNITITTGEWNHVCFMWSTHRTRIAVMMSNGLSEWIHYPQTSAIRAGGQFVLGQDQDTVGGGFDPKQVFNGELTDLHMWNYWIPTSTVQKFHRCSNDVEGNIISWNHLPMTLNNVGVIYSPSDIRSYC